MSKLVIVESPTKAKTIQKYLGSDYEVMASKGHVRDLPKSSFGVNIAKGFVPQYLNVAGKEKMIRQLREEAAKSDFVYLATDPDREGEAIAWHLSYLLGLPEGQHNRVTFGEISKSGIEKGMAAPRAIDQNIVNSQQTRRILDRIVGYKLSPLLWSSIKRGLSAGVCSRSPCGCWSIVSARSGPLFRRNTGRWTSSSAAPAKRFFLPA